jgi:two-component system NtrC family response regulator
LKILFADDEGNLQKIIGAELPRRGHRVTVCKDGAEALVHLEDQSYDCMIVDLQMPGISGIELIRQSKELAPDTDAIILTGNKTIDSAIEAVRLGAFDYLTKPYKLAMLEPVLQRLASHRKLKNELRATKHQLARWEGNATLLGTSLAMDTVRKLISKVAPTNATVLIRGETGTGKELAARAVHDQSGRCGKPFVAVNCGALPETLIESELFGHGKGAFTGADRKRAGLFEVTEGGTLFLDEMGELPRSLQAKLLRVLETGEIRRVGETDAFSVDVRVVCATHRDLAEMVQQDLFRQDLLFRINMFEIVMPPLRHRAEDIPDLARYLLGRFRRTARNGEGFSAEALRALQQYSWPGNVRELANVIEHASIVCDSLPIRLSDLPPLGARAKRLQLDEPISLRELELRAIEAALERHHGNKLKASEELGISAKTLYNKLAQTNELEKSA